MEFPKEFHGLDLQPGRSGLVDKYNVGTSGG
jgi:hypothetical protein